MAQATHIVKFFLFSVQSNGFVYFARFGGSGGVPWPVAVVGCIDGSRLVGCGSSVSKVKYLQTISSVLESTGRSLSLKSFSCSSCFSFSMSLLLLEAGSEVLRESTTGNVVIPELSILDSTPKCESLGKSISGFAAMRPFESSKRLLSEALVKGRRSSQSLI